MKLHVSAYNGHRQVSTRTQRVPPERDDNHDKPEFGGPKKKYLC